MAEQLLAGLNIVVTRPRDQAAGLARRIEELGGRAIIFPLLEITPVPESALHEYVARLILADLAIFISPNAARYGIAAIRAAGALPPSLKIAAVGQGTARALRELGIDCVAPRERFDSEGLLALPELQNVAGMRITILRGDGGRELLGDTLKARGAAVDYVTCYVRSKPQLDADALQQTLPDAITVTSSEALRHLRDALDEERFRAVAAIPLFLPHERIAQAARQQGWTHVVVTESGDDGLVSGLIAWADAKRKQVHERSKPAGA